VTVAEGPNGEGCDGCDTAEFGCCPDMFTPALGPDLAGCDCAASLHGCCPARGRPWAQSLKVVLRSQERLARSPRMQDLETNSVFSGSLISRKVDVQGFGMVAVRGTGTGFLTRSLVRLSV